MWELHEGPFDNAKTHEEGLPDENYYTHPVVIKLGNEICTALNAVPARELISLCAETYLEEFGHTKSKTKEKRRVGKTV